MVTEEHEVIVATRTAAGTPATLARTRAAMPNEFLSFRLGGEE